ncbi:tRNA (guanosine(37)-N1)-methyltransferase TrmD [Opitutales bacterium ASA1]|uniref:tRNA (guanosine(37)-N1)-methyltransferase TrmD n=1 Tax=Congregicoccus parvus TaxID=3081749 RepID=UPI002B31E5FD|nr:tRNA (guanosine(37)-N1)-methyltransferase TrmD [Opitutales bacterium ASA1]
MRIDIITLFPAMLDGFLGESMLGRACAKGLIDVRVHNLRDWATDKHQVTDDRPFGGGAGMVLKPEPVFAAIEALRTPEAHVVYLSPDGVPLSPAVGESLSVRSHLIFLSGHYEGIDQRIRDRIVDAEISIGDYVLTNGTLAAAVVVDVMARFVPGVLGEEKSLTHESFTRNVLDFPQYTRPAEFRGWKVPEVLLSGNHALIERWRAEQSLEKTRRLRPDLLIGHHETHHRGTDQSAAQDRPPRLQGG